MHELSAGARPLQADGSLDYFNQRWLDYLGIALDDIKGWGWISKIHPDDVEAFVKEWRSSLTDKGVKPG